MHSVKKQEQLWVLFGIFLKRKGDLAKSKV